MNHTREGNQTQNVTHRLILKLRRQHPKAYTELAFSNPYELLVATILSAQCTDKQVNSITPLFFLRYPDAPNLAQAAQEEIEHLVKPTGFFRSKSRFLIGMASAIVNRHNGLVPQQMEALVRLPGVGRKTANVVLGHGFGIPGLPVDRHVLRVSIRLGLTRSQNPIVVEKELCEQLPRKLWTASSDTLIFHGRRICKPQPLCSDCGVAGSCPSAKL